MFYKQYGLIPVIVKFIGYCILFYFVIGTIVTALTIDVVGDSAKVIFINRMKLLVLIPLFTSPFILVSLFFILMFPSLYITDIGVQSKLFLFLNINLFRWNEIDDFIRVSSRANIYGFTISRKGFPLFNGLFFNSLYSKCLFKSKPLILISTKNEVYQEMLKVITKFKNNAKPFINSPST